MKSFVIEARWRGAIKSGWGNGYVVIPKDHPLYGKDYDAVDLDVHGGITFAEKVNEHLLENWGQHPECEGKLTREDIGKWVFGFDTAHYGDDLETWPYERVLEETSKLYSQLNEMYAVPHTFNRNLTDWGFTFAIMGLVGLLFILPATLFTLLPLYTLLM